MPLSKKQHEAARKMAEAKRRGETVGIQFFERLEAAGGQLWEEYKAVLEGKAGDGGKVGKRANLDTKIRFLSPKQVSVAVAKALELKSGEEFALRFYAEQQRLAEQGYGTAKEFVAVMDEVREKQAHGIDVYEKPGITTETPKKLNGGPPAIERETKAPVLETAQTMLEKATRLRAIADAACKAADAAELAAAAAAKIAAKPATTEETTATS